MTHTRSFALLIALALAGTAHAQTAQPNADPIIGAWTLNPGLTTASPGIPIALPTRRTEEYRDAGAGRIQLVVTTGNSDGSTTVARLTFSARGGMVTQDNAQAGETAIETRVAPREWRVTFLKNGVQILTLDKVISADGKTLHQRLSGVTEQGTPFEGTLVFARQ